MELYRDNGTELRFPECVADSLIPIFIESGMASASFNGSVTLTWSELESYLNVFDYKLSHWATDVLRKMSRAYVAELNNEKDRFPPFAEVKLPSNEEREAISNNIRDMFKAMKAAQQKQK